MKRWKNPEAPRKAPQLQAVFDAVYLEADQLLRDCMDLRTATGMRLTDCIEAVTDGAYVYFMAHKTGKAAFFDINKSAVLQRLSVARNRGELVLRGDGPVTERKLNDRWKKARAVAAARAGGRLGELIEATYLRDMRKLAADLAPSLQHAADLLQHQDEATTRRHYRSAATELTPVR